MTATNNFLNHKIFRGGIDGGGTARPPRGTHGGGLLLALLMTSGCATSSTRNTILRDMAIGAIAGAAIAQTKEDNKAAYTSMYAGIGAATAGVLSVIVNSGKDDSLKNENEQLKAKLDQFQKQSLPQLVQKGSSLYSSPIPSEVAGLVEPGEWKRYKMDQWVQDPNQSNTWYRQVEMFEIIPPASK